MKAVRKPTDNRWLLLFIERWLTAPIQLENGTTISRKRGAQVLKGAINGESFLYFIRHQVVPHLRAGSNYP